MASSTSALTSALLSGSIVISGLGSGTDFNEVIDQLVEIESINMNRLEKWKSTWEEKITVITALNTRMLALEEAAGAMDTEKEFLSRAATSSNTSVVTATATSSASTGASTVTVGQNVKHIVSTAGCADADTTAYGGSGGTLILESNGVSYNVAIDAADTLNDIVDKINAVTGENIVASIENDGTSSNQYHLVLTSGTGGDAGRITATQNPTALSLGGKDMVVSDTSSWGGASIGLTGMFTGDKSVASVYGYTFTVASSSNPSTIGADSFELNWTASAGGGSGTITVPADYTPGDSIEVEKGVFIQLGEGSVSDGESFSVNAYANDIDDAELGTWSGPAISTEGNYQGSVSKTFSFEVISAGNLQAGGGGDTIVMRWTDSLGNTGTVSLSDADQSYEVDQGFTIKLDAGTVTHGDDFQVNVFAPDKQQGQDTGLAQNCKLIHEGFSDTTITPVTDSDATFTYTYGGETTSVAVEAGTVLADLVDKINNDENNPGVEASIVNDGLGLPNSYRLVLTGTNTGAQYQISSVEHDFTGSNFSSGGDAGGGFSTSQLATNSMIQVDGFPTGDVFLQRTSNTVTDVITGVSLALVDGGTSRVTVSVDASAVADKIEAFINAVNYVQDYIRSNTKYDAEGDETGVLIGNYAFQIAKSQIDSLLNSSIPGLTDGEDAYTLLQQIGITSNPDDEGRWIIDEDILEDALADNPEAVAKLFINDTTTGSSGVAKQMYDLMDTQTNDETGICSVLISNYEGIVKNIDKKIDSEEARLELYRQRQVEKFARLEATLSTLSNTQTALESAIAELPSSSGD
ncbi:flagellar filament capping protein FliD [Desulfarculus baarsii]